MYCTTSYFSPFLASLENRPTPYYTYAPGIERRKFLLLCNPCFFFNNRHHKNSFWAKTPSVFMEEMGHDCLMLSPTALLACNHGGNCLCPIFSNQNHVGSGVSAVCLPSNRTMVMTQKAERVLLVTEHTAHRAVFTA